MQHRHLNRQQYFHELTVTSERYFLPYIKQFIEISKKTKVLEIGCGEGGNLLPFAKLDCEVTGIDISSTRIEQAKSFFKDSGYDGIFLNKNILEFNPQEKQYDIVIIHDVIEHIYFKEELLRLTKQLITQGGICFVGFPSWQMPFGGHQQICQSKFISHFPFVHLLPNKIYKFILNSCNESTSRINSLFEIKLCRMTIDHFEKLIKTCEWQVIDKKFYFINPHYEIKFGLQPRILSKYISNLPYIRDYFSTSCFYILK